MPFRKLFKNQKYLNELDEIEHEFKTETTEDIVEITIYGDIGSYWWGSTSASDIKKVLDEHKGKDVIVNLNRPGGDAFDGIAIYNQLKKHDGKVFVNVDGWAASAASIIAMAADELIMNTGTMMMIHEASVIAWGTKKKFKSVLNSLEGLDSSLADIYMTRFKGERSEIETFIENETWFTATEAVDIGLADKVNEVDEPEGTDPEEFKNSVLARFRKNDENTIKINTQKIGEVTAETIKPVASILEKFKRQ